MDYKNINDYEVLYMIKEKDDYAQDIMFSKYKPVIMNIAVKYIAFAKSKGADYDDLIQEGYIGLNSAINNYKDDCDTLFYSYANLCIERQIQIFCRNISSKKADVLNNSCLDDITYMNQVSTDVLSNPENYNFNQFEDKMLLKYMRNLNFKDSCIFELRCNGFSYKEISSLLDIPVSTIDGRLYRIRRHIEKLDKNLC